MCVCARVCVCVCQAKEELEQALGATAVPLQVTQECLTLRQGRRGLELVGDPVEEELKQEVRLIERVQQELQQHVGRTFEQLWYGQLSTGNPPSMTATVPPADCMLPCLSCNLLLLPVLSRVSLSLG